ncbi:hypothetical protein DKT74_20435 [Streptomyces sp. ZEA17I]|uniref:hypothetical protein n=1 Tax=Streptomyces sp. ZEA17I TaxID=2202516 RepID=UPI000D702FB0|nr:hypothetical protein [Streptomyces sp. ZEA17I]PWS42768.1 hypothetical protein DKT74_20435 [Streptomyces sp. ZEA17I]
MSPTIKPLPAAETVAVRAHEIHAAIEADQEFSTFKAASLKYDADWQCFTGSVVVAHYDQERDKHGLFDEGLRALCLKAAVFELTGDENAAEIPVAVPVDEMTHAMIAQPQLLARIAARVGVAIIHQTDQEHTDWREGDYTHRAYRAVWGEPDRRLWLPAEEVTRRLAWLDQKYAAMGFRKQGQAHDFGFSAEELSVVAA